jgi:hypothetical protein
LNHLRAIAAGLGKVIGAVVSPPFSSGESEAEAV